MSRPVYETQESLLNEAEVASRVAAIWGCATYKMPRRMQIDYAISRDDVVCGFVEVKCRTKNIDDYPYYFIALTKVMEAKNLNQTTGLPCFLAVRSANGKIHMIRLDDADFTVKIAGRRDRNDPDDIEPCCFFEVSKFKELK